MAVVMQLVTVFAILVSMERSVTCVRSMILFFFFVFSVTVSFWNRKKSEQFLKDKVYIEESIYVTVQYELSIPFFIIIGKISAYISEQKRQSSTQES